MRILIANKYAHATGGADQHCLLLTEALRSRGHDVAWISTDHPNNEEHAGRFIRMSYSSSRERNLSLRERAVVLSTSMWSREAKTATDDLVQAFRPHVMHAHKLYPQLSVAPIVAAHEAGIAIVQTMHDYEFVGTDETTASRHGSGRQQGSAQRALKLALWHVKKRVHIPRVSRWIAVSDFVASAALRATGIHAETIHPLVASPVEEPVDISSRAGVVFVGRLTEEKGIADVISLASTLPPGEVSVIGDGPLRPLVEASNAAYLGSLPHGQALAALARARVCVFPIKWDEPAGMVPLEAMARGTPVVGYPRGGFEQYGRNGSVMASDFDGLSFAVGVLLNDPERWMRASAEALLTSRNYLLSAAISKLEHVYESATER